MSCRFMGPQSPEKIGKHLRLWPATNKPRKPRELWFFQWCVEGSWDGRQALILNTRCYFSQTHTLLSRIRFIQWKFSLVNLYLNLETSEKESRCFDLCQLSQWLQCGWLDVLTPKRKVTAWIMSYASNPEWTAVDVAQGCRGHTRDEWVTANSESPI